MKPESAETDRPFYSGDPVPQICPISFNNFFFMVQPLLNVIRDNPNIADDIREELIINVCMACTLTVNDGAEDLAVAYASRILSLNNCTRAGMVEAIGRDFFGGPDYLYKVVGPNIYMRGIVLCSAACAGLYYGENRFSYAELSTAILTAEAGCSVDPCPSAHKDCLFNARA